MFKAARVSRRCLVPADAFCKWKVMADGKQPYAIARRNGRLLAFAGVWKWWKTPSESRKRQKSDIIVQMTVQVISVEPSRSPDLAPICH